MQEDYDSSGEQSRESGPSREPRAARATKAIVDGHAGRLRTARRTRRFSFFIVNILSTFSSGLFIGLVAGVASEFGGSPAARIWIGCIFPPVLMAGWVLFFRWLGRYRRPATKEHPAFAWVFCTGYAVVYFGHLALLVRELQR